MKLRHFAKEELFIISNTFKNISHDYRVTIAAYIGHELLSFVYEPVDFSMTDKTTAQEILQLNFYQIGIIFYERRRNNIKISEGN